MLACNQAANKLFTISEGETLQGRLIGEHVPLLAKVTGALGARCACVFTGVRQHVPISAVRELIGRNLEGFLPA